MYSSKLSISRRFSMSVTWNILCILPCSFNLMFTTLLKNQVECIFMALLSCRHLQASCWFSCDIISLTKGLPESFKFVSSWDLVPGFLRLHINDCFCLRGLNCTMTLSDLFMRWQACKSSGTTLTRVSDSALQILSSKRSSWISIGTAFSSIASRLLYWELVTALRSNWMILVSRWKL